MKLTFNCRLTRTYMNIFNVCLWTAHTWLPLWSFVLRSNSGQNCSELGSQWSMLKVAALVDHDLQTCDVITDYSTHLTSYLDSCSFMSDPTAVWINSCTTSCHESPDCQAVTFSLQGGCEMCLATSAGAGNGNTYDVSAIMIFAEHFSAYIDGNKSLFIQGSLHTLKTHTNNLTS